MAEIWFSSDLHLYHDKPFLFEPRGFSGREEHTEKLIENFNEVVRPGDTLYLLGDNWLTCSLEEGLEAFKRIKCDNIKLIWGNHDSPQRRAALLELPNVEGLGYSDLIKIKKNFYLISHYITLTANYDDTYHKAIRNLHGHTHSKEKLTSPYTINVSVDAWDNYPANFEEIEGLIRKDILGGNYEK